MSLYRKYRPKAFADVIGQDHVVTTLENAVTQKKLAHAYLFAGGRGTGKTSVARILARILLTEGMDDEKLKKQVLEGIDEGHLVDLVEIDAASNRGIDDVRELIEKIQFSPVVSKAKVYIIDEVHMLTREAFNALLKTLEEPPPYAYFILATTELQKIPATIQSRCQRFAFRQITDDDLVRGLQKIVDAEGIAVERQALRSIAHAAQGGMRDAISLLDQLRSLASITLDDVRQRTGETGIEFVERVFAALGEGKSSELIAAVRDVEDAGIAMDVFARQLLAEARKRLHSAAESGQDLGGSVALLESLLGAIRSMRITPVPGLALEAALLRIGGVRLPERKLEAEPPRATTSAPKKDMHLEPKVLEKKKSVAPDTKEEPSIASAAIEAPEVSLQELHRQWSDVVSGVTTPSVRMSLKNGRVTEVRGSAIRIAFTSAFHRDKVKATDSSRQLEEVLQKIFKRALRIECILDGATGAPTPTDPGMVNLAEAASEVF